MINKKILLSLFMFVIFCSSVHSALTDDILSYYKLDDNGNDATPNGYNCNPNGISWVAGKINNAADFERDESNDKCNLTNDAFKITDAFTVTAWIQPESLYDHNLAIFDNLDYSGADYAGFGLLLRSTGAIAMDIWTGTGSENNCRPIASGNFTTVGTWYFVAGTFDTVANQIVLYVNGYAASTTVCNFQPGYLATYKGFNIGHVVTTGMSQNFDGIIDELGVWDRKLNSSEILNLYDAGVGKTYPFGAVSGSNFSVTAVDEWTGQLLNISVLIDGVTYGPNITVSTAILTNATSTYDVVVMSQNYFNKTYVATNVSSSLDGSLHQAEICFNASAKVSGDYIVANNFTINNTVTSSCLNISVGTYNVMAQKTGWYNKNQTIVVSALQTNTITIENMSYANLTISAMDGTTNESLTNYNISIFGIAYPSFVETAGVVTNYSFYLIDGVYNVSIDVPGYAITTAVANVTVSGNTNYTFTLYKSNSVNIQIRDEITNALITDSVVVRWSNNATTWENTTTSGSLFVYNISADVYTVLFYSTNYSTRTYTITVGNSSTQSLNAYLVSSTYSTIFTIKDKDSGDLVNDVSMTMYKLINSSWTIVESKYSDITGKAQFYYDPIASYKFFLSKSNYTDYVFYLNPILFSEYDVMIQRTSIINNTVDFDHISIIYAPQIFYNNFLNSFNWLISNPDGELINYAITLRYPGGQTTASGVNIIGEQLNLIANISGSSSWDVVYLEYNYTSSIGGLRQFNTNLPIITNGTANTWANANSSGYGLGLFERVLIASIIVIFVVGIATLVGQPIPGAVLGLFVFGFLAKINFIPLWAILPSMVVGFLFVTWRSGG